MSRIKKQITKCTICSETNQDGTLLDYQGNEYAICSNCGTWYQVNTTIVKYDATYWGEVMDPDGVKRNLTEERDSKIKNWYGNTINHINTIPHGKILDIGAGLGFFLSAISDKWEKHAFDISEEALSFIKKTTPAVYRHNNLDDIVEKLGNEYFDVIMCYHVIEHLPDASSLIDSMNDLLKPGGLMIIGTPNAESYTAKRFKGNFRLLDRTHLSILTKKSISLLIKKYKLKIIEMEYPYFKTDYFTFRNITRLFNKKKLSPPFYGSIMTAYIRKEE